MGPALRAIALFCLLQGKHMAIGHQARCIAHIIHHRQHRLWCTFFKPKYCIEEREILTHFGLFVAHSLVYAFAGPDNAAVC